MRIIISVLDFDGENCPVLVNLYMGGTVNSLNPKSDQHLISPNNNTAESLLTSGE